MPKYAVKIGEVILQSDKPITPEERKAAMRELKRGGYSYVIEEGLFIATRPDKV